MWRKLTVVRKKNQRRSETARRESLFSIIVKLKKEAKDKARYGVRCQREENSRTAISVEKRSQGKRPRAIGGIFYAIISIAEKKLG